MQAFHLATQALRIQCLGERKGKAQPPVLPQLLSSDSAECPDNSTIPEPGPMQVLTCSYSFGGMRRRRSPDNALMTLLACIKGAHPTQSDGQRWFRLHWLEVGLEGHMCEEQVDFFDNHIASKRSMRVSCAAAGGGGATAGHFEGHGGGGAGVGGAQAAGACCRRAVTAGSIAYRRRQQSSGVQNPSLIIAMAGAADIFGSTPS